MAHNANGFPQNMRIKSRSDFMEIQNTGRSFRNREFIVCYKLNKKETSRYGITVSRKVGNAVERNRVRRSIREGIRLNNHRPKGVDVVFIAKSYTAKRSTLKLIQSVDYTLQKIGGLL